MNPKDVVVMSMVGSGMLVVVDDVRTGGIKGTHILALGMVFIVVSASADIAPQVAVPFSLLVFTGIALTKGAKVFNAFGNVGNAGKLPQYGEKPSTFVPKKGGN